MYDVWRGGSIGTVSERDVHQAVSGILIYSHECGMSTVAGRPGGTGALPRWNASGGYGSSARAATAAPVNFFTPVTPAAIEKFAR